MYMMLHSFFFIYILFSLLLSALLLVSAYSFTHRLCARVAYAGGYFWKQSLYPQVEVGVGLSIPSQHKLLSLHNSFQLMEVIFIFCTNNSPPQTVTSAALLQSQMKHVTLGMLLQ